MNSFIKIFLFFFLVISIGKNNSYSANEVKIIFKVDGEIITNIDIKKEFDYLLALNNDLKKIDTKKGIKIAKQSIINEKIKKIELEKYFDLKNELTSLDDVIKNFYKTLGFKSLNEFKKNLKNFDLKYENVKKKIQIETLWNQLIFAKYKNQIKIDIEKLKKIASKKNKSQKSYLLSEILFKNDNTITVEQKYNLIKLSINEVGFKNSANIYSLAPTAKIGGKIGWLSENQLSKKIKNVVLKLNVGEFSKPINITNGVLILKLDKVKKVKVDIDVKKELLKLVNYERNKQLNQMSNIYFNKIKNNSSINEF